MIELAVTAEQIKRAEELYSFYNIKNSITEGKSQIYGAIGEVISIDYFGATPSPCKDYDITINGYTIDVKTKKCNSDPKYNYLCSVATTSMHQRCDHYLFCRVKSDMSRAWILGFYPKDKFFNDATFARKGEAETPQFNFTTDCYNMPIERLFL